MVIYHPVCQTTFNLVQLVSILFLIFISILFLNTCRLFPYQFYLFFERGLASSNCQLTLMSLDLVVKTAVLLYRQQHYLTPEHSLLFFLLGSNIIVESMPQFVKKLINAFHWMQCILSLSSG